MTSAVSRQFVLPDLGEGVSEGQVLRLLVAEGDRVEEDQLLMEVETDKAAVEIPSPFSGVVTQWHVSEQQRVNVGDAMVTFAVDGDEGATGDGADPAPAPPEAHAARAPRPSADAPAPLAAANAPAPAPGSRTPASPAVRKLARTLGVDLATVAASGPGGRVLRADVERAASPCGAGVSPARERPVTSGAGGTPAPQEGVDDRDANGPIRRVPLTRTRRAIAEVMARSASVIPHVTDCDDADVTELDRLRRGYNETAADDERLSLLPFVIRALCRALHAFPIFNASFDEERGEVVHKRYFNIAVGVQTERGLAAPVLHHADRMTIPEIAAGLRHLARHARDGRVTLDETRGATYTVSNAGAMGGSRYSTPIITHPQVAVLAIGRSRLQPWVVEGEVRPRLIMPLSHSMDHRVIDGAVEIAFMKQLIGDLEQPGRLLI